MKNEANILNKILCLNQEGSEEYKSVVIVNNFLINSENLMKLELMIHQMKAQAEGRVLHVLTFRSPI